MTEPKVTEYAELHAHSAFSFLDGASHPEELAAEAARLGVTALATPTWRGRSRRSVPARPSRTWTAGCPARPPRTCVPPPRC